MIISLEVPHEEKGSPSKTIRLEGGQLDGFPLLYIGKDSYIVSLQNEASINLSEEKVYNVHIGKYCAIAHQNSFVIDINHNYNQVCTGNICLPTIHHKKWLHHTPVLKRKGQIIIQNDVWIGRGATIMGGVTVHNGAVIAANSVVTKDVEAYSIVGGNPARVIKYRFTPDVISKLLTIQWWNWTDLKVRENAEWFSRDITDFAEHFYEDALSAVPIQRKLNIEKSNKQFIYFADFEEDKYGTWDKVILGFCDTFQSCKDCGLIVFIDQGRNTELQYQKIEKLTETLDSDCSLYIFAGSEADTEELFKTADYYITGRNQKTVFYSCLADRYGVKMISGVDLPIFSSPEEY